MFVNILCDEPCTKFLGSAYKLLLSNGIGIATNVRFAVRQTIAISIPFDAAETMDKVFGLIIRLTHTPCSPWSSVHFTLATWHLSQICDIAQWRVAKQTAVLAAELGGAFIADLKRSSCRILIFG